MSYKNITSLPQGKLHFIVLGKAKYPEGCQWIENGKCQGQHTLEEREVLEGRADPNPTSPRPLARPDTQGKDCKDSFAIRSVFKA